MKVIIRSLLIILLAVSLIPFSAYAAIERKAKVSSNDSTAGYLNGKLVAGSGITFTENNDGGNETLSIAANWETSLETADIDTFAELQAIVADKTLMNEEDTTYVASESDPTVDTAAEIMAIIGVSGVQSANINWSDVDAEEIQSAGINWNNVETLAPLTEAMIGDLGSYLTTESDPVYIADPAFGITAGHITNWDTAYGWGDHSGSGYLTDVQSSDINWDSVNANELQQNGLNWDSIPNIQNGKVLVWRSANNVNWETFTAVVGDGDKGDITVSGTGTVWSIDSLAVQSADINWSDVKNLEVQMAGFNWDSIDNFGVGKVITYINSTTVNWETPEAVSLGADSVQSSNINWIDITYLEENGLANTVVSGAAPTVDAAGEVAIDTTDDQVVYYGGAERVIPYTTTKCMVVENLAAADDDFEMGMFVDAVTITGVGLHCKGTCTTGADISLEDRAGNAMTHTTPTHSTGTGSTTFQNVTAGNSLVAGEGLRFDVDNAVSPETDVYTICYNYTTDRQ